MTAFPEYEQYDAVGLAALIRSGDVTADEVLDAALARLDERNPDINAVVTSRASDARAEVAGGLSQVDVAAPLRGVPYLVKDLNTQIAGVRGTDGSRLFADYVAPRDSVVVERMRAAGLVILGKTNTPEFGLNATTEGRFLGAARNPWNREHSTGGSSGGSAAAVAAGIVPAAHATDGGGSIRIPASCCGLFGLKPTRARLPFAPYAGEGWAGLSIGHAVTRSVRDSAALLDATAGPAAGDPYAAPAPARPFREEVGADPGVLRVGVLEGSPSHTAVDDECRAAVAGAARLCEQLGHAVETCSWPSEVSELAAGAFVVMQANVARKVDARLAVLGRAPADDDLESFTRMMADMGRAARAIDYVEAVDNLRTLGRVIAGMHEHFDVLLSPVLGRPPVPLGELDPNEDLARFGAAITSYVAFTGVANATGAPAMSVPLHWSAGGLPVGVQFQARFGGEATLLRVGAQLENAQPWWDRRASGYGR